MKKNSQKNSYQGKEVFVGIDVHKKTYSVVSIVEGSIVKKWRTTAKPEKLTKQLKGYFPGAKIYGAYEAGFSGFVLHRQLEKSGIKSVPIA